MIEIGFPTQQEIEETRKFQTYLNYVGAISNYLCKCKPEDFVYQMVPSKEYPRIKCKGCEPSLITKLLRNSWLTEVKLHIDGDDNDFSAYSNHWAPVQLYYSVYLSLRAFFLSSASSVPGEHTKNLSAIANEISNRPGLFPYPYKTLVVKSGGKTREENYQNLPDGLLIEQVSALQSFKKSSFYDLFSTCLKTTRDKKIEKACDEWKVRERKRRIAPKAKAAIAKNIGNVSIFDFLYRLRLRSNYEDADLFFLSIHNSNDAMEFNKGLRVIAWYTLLMIETLITKAHGKTRFEAIANDFVMNESHQIASRTIGKRIATISAGLKRVEDARARKMVNNSAS